jgi:glycosyltransferase involved in cell wall biosynthesis
VRLLIDGQCIQSTSSLRGIGRYALSLTRALVQEAAHHQVEVLLNGGDDPTRLLRARAALETFLPARSIHVFDAPWPWTPPYDDARRPAAEAAHAAAVRSLSPDALLIGSVFEGDGENVVTVKPPGGPPTAAVLYDLIPALDPGKYLLGPGAALYWRRFEAFQRCDALLAISRHSGSQALQLLGDACPPVTPMWGGPYPSGDFPAFEPQHDDDPGLVLPTRFVLSVGGDHPRKNLDRLVAAWANVSRELRADTPLVIACRLNTGTVRRLRRIARRSGLADGDLVLTGGVSERTLRDLYARALAFVFPSLEEGLGMPPLEAMAAGCPTLLAAGSSLSELSDDPACYFDGLDVEDITGVVTAVLASADVRRHLRRGAAASAQHFTWRHTATLAWGALSAMPRATEGRRVPLPTVRLSNASAISTLAGAPAPVVLDAPLPQGPLGQLGLPLAPRAALAPATALVAGSGLEQASAAVRAGLLDQPVLLHEEGLMKAAAHDFHAAYAEGLAGLEPMAAPLATAVVRAALRSPRWTLERPRPVWLLLTRESPTQELINLAADAGVDLVTAQLEAVSLAVSADVVLLHGTDVTAVEAALAHARRRGAVVAALHQTGAQVTTPSWCADLVLEGPALAPSTWEAAVLPRSRSWGRTTGWPWRDGD